MGYYIRVLAEKDVSVPVTRLNDRLSTEAIAAQVLAEIGPGDNWTEAIVQHLDGQEIVVVEKNRVSPGQLGAEEIAEFMDSIENARPASAAAWLKEYLPAVKVIYALQILSGAYVGDGWKAVHAIQGELWGTGGGILQADGEGFSNLSGYHIEPIRKFFGCVVGVAAPLPQHTQKDFSDRHILWQFSNDVQGLWSMAVLDENGIWIPFQMELGDKRQRKAFLTGKVPPSAKRL